jgi:senataxin
MSSSVSLLNIMIHFCMFTSYLALSFGDFTRLELSSILKAFILLLKRLGNRLWEGEQTNYPEIVFDSIKDNSSYLDLLLQNDTTTERPWYFAWYSEFLHTVSGLVAYDAVLAKMVGFMCEELQHERFGHARSDAMCAAVRVSDEACSIF